MIGTPSAAKNPGETVRKRARGSSSPGRADVAVGRELQARTEVAGVAPRNNGADGHAIHARQFRDAPHGFLVEADDLIGRLSVRHHRHVQREHVARIEAGLRRLQREQRLEQHAGAGQQHEGRGDLGDREDPLPAAGAAGDRAGCRSTRRIRAMRRPTAGAAQTPSSTAATTASSRAHPEHAGIDRQIERAHREAGGVARQDGHHRPRAQHAQRRAGAAQQQAFGQQRPAQRARAGAQRRADRQFAFAPNGPRENQVGDVRARDDEDQHRRRQQHQQHGSGART